MFAHNKYDDFQKEEPEMNNMNFVKGISLGLMVGAGVGMMITPSKKSGKSTVSKALRAMGDLLEDVETALGW